MGSLLLLVALVWAASARPVAAPRLEPGPPVTGPLPSGEIAPMHSPAIGYSAGWRVDAHGADPREPADPWHEPAGVFEFTYAGQELVLLVARGDYWGYLYTTVDGAPANRLARIPGNVDSRGMAAGYATFYAPEQALNGLPSVYPLVVHRAHTPGVYTVRVEVWRSWGQVPVRGVGVDVLPAARPLWPAVLAAIVGMVLLYDALGRRRGAWLAARLDGRVAVVTSPGIGRLIPILYPGLARRWAWLAAILGMGLVGGAVYAQLWWATWLGLGLLAWAGLFRPAYWIGALAFGLPFYYSANLPLLPGRALGLIDVGLLFGLVVLTGYYVLRCLSEATAGQASTRHAHNGARLRMADATPARALWALIGWAAVTTAAAHYWPQALYEWRTVFLAAGLFWILTVAGIAGQEDKRARTFGLFWVLGAWLAGGIVVAGLALFQYAGDFMLITAEGVARVRGLYGSPNNLALYLERTLLVSLGLALYLPQPVGRGLEWLRGLLWVAVLAQLGALILTFSKGALLLGLPVGLAVLWGVGLVLLPRQGRGRKPLWLLLGLAAVALLALAPFLGAERFRNLLDLGSGTGFLRLQLWRSAWAMGWDHWLLGVGPDNFLYLFRSGYLLPAAWQEPNLNHPHNLFLDAWTRLGLPGLALVLLFFGAGVVRLARLLWVQDSALPDATKVALAAGCLAAALAGLAHGLIDVSYALPDIMLVWILLFYLPVMHRSGR